MATRGAISAEIGHELNNFLGVVAGNIDLLQAHLKRGHYDRLEKYLNTVSDTLAKITRFTNNLMDLRSISSAKEPVQFDSLITEVVEYLRPQKRFKGVEIIIPSRFDAIPFLADTTQIQQLLYNLFHNAADATVDCARREITVAVDANPENGTFRLSIEDTGTGFDTAMLEKAFREKFTTKEFGHGFGLVVCKRIIDNHNGELTVESAPGEGSCISITFPLATAVAEPVPVG
jgi:signal transduction histidine kinase